MGIHVLPYFLVIAMLFFTLLCKGCQWTMLSRVRVWRFPLLSVRLVVLSLFLHLRRHLRYRPHPDICTGGAHNQGIEWIAHVEGLDLSRGKELPRVLEHGVE